MVSVSTYIMANILKGTDLYVIITYDISLFLVPYASSLLSIPLLLLLCVLMMSKCSLA